MIYRRKFEEQDRKELQDRIIRRVECAQDFYLDAYDEHPMTFGGRYICADMFKEFFHEYRTSKSTRARYNAVVHNPAAFLAGEQFNKVVSDDTRIGDEVYFLTGVPGAGKTSSIESRENLFEGLRAIFEGQVSRPESVISKIEMVFQFGLKSGIIVAHTRPEKALEHVLKRFVEMGRGASIDLMAEIQGNLPQGLKKINDRFGESIGLIIYDYTEHDEPVQKFGWGNLPLLETGGTHEEIRGKLGRIIEQRRRDGTISEACYEQAYGRIPRDFPGDDSLWRRDYGERKKDEPGRGIQKEDSCEDSLKVGAVLEVLIEDIGDIGKAATYVVSLGIDPREEKLEACGISRSMNSVLRDELRILAAKPEEYGISKERLGDWGERFDIGREAKISTPFGLRKVNIYDNF